MENEARMLAIYRYTSEEMDTLLDLWYRVKEINETSLIPEKVMQVPDGIKAELVPRLSIDEEVYKTAHYQMENREQMNPNIFKDLLNGSTDPYTVVSFKDYKRRNYFVADSHFAELHVFVYALELELKYIPLYMNTIQGCVKKVFQWRLKEGK
jgi:hypothetical protein